MRKFSPGPWKVYRCPFAGKSEACGLILPDGEAIHFDCSADECHHPLSIENATLIASAPVLYSALQAAEKVLRGEYQHWTHRKVSKKHCYEAGLDVVQKALASVEINGGGGKG